MSDRYQWGASDQQSHGAHHEADRGATLSIQTTIRAEAADAKHGMTLDELAAFVQQAMREGVDGGTVVRIQSTWRSSIRAAEVAGQTEVTA